jgi:S1-C subfamily serine protease
MGTELSSLDDAAAQSRGLPGAMGALVESIVPGSPAEAAGLRSGDVLLVINGEFVDAVPDVLRELGQVSPGSRIDIRIMRNRRELTVTITLGRRPAG